MLFGLLSLVWYAIATFGVFAWRGPYHPLVISWNYGVKTAATFVATRETFAYYAPRGYECALRADLTSRYWTGAPTARWCWPILNEFPVRLANDSWAIEFVDPF